MSCGISRDNQLLNEQATPHMIEDCYSAGSWNLPDFEDKCCKGILGPNNINVDGQCRPTIEGGYCVDDVDDGVDDGRRVYYKYKLELDEYGNQLIREPYEVRRSNIGRETPYTEDPDDTHRAGITDIQELQDEFYNELMINRIMASEPTVIKRNLEKEELDIQEMEEDDLRSSKKLLKQEVVQITETNDILKILIGVMVLIGVGFAIYFIIEFSENTGSTGSKGSKGSKIRPLGQASSKGSTKSTKSTKGSTKGSKGKGLNIDIKDILKNFRNYFK